MSRLLYTFKGSTNTTVFYKRGDYKNEDYYHISLQRRSTWTLIAFHTIGIGKGILTHNRLGTVGFSVDFSVDISNEKVM